MRFEPHCHSEFSNIRMLDCINKPKDIVKRAKDIGLSGFAITDHEALCRSSANKFLSRRIR